MDYRSLGIWSDGSSPTCTSVEEEIIDRREPSAEAVTLDERIAELEKQLATLRTEKDALLAREALVTRLPPEVLARILEFTAIMDNNAVYTLELVSRHWRTTALSTPLLYSYITLGSEWSIELIRPDGTYRHASFVAYAEKYIQRSGATKLAFDINLTHAPPAEMAEIPALISAHLGRCFSLKITASGPEQLDEMRKHATPKLGSSLEELVLRLETTSGSDEAPEPVPFLDGEKEYPHLRSVTLVRTPLALLGPVRSSALPALRVLRFGQENYRPKGLFGCQCSICRGGSSGPRMGVALPELLEFLLAHPLLEELALCELYFQTDATATALLADPDSLRAKVAHLRRLAIHDLHDSDASVFLRALDAPALAHLAFSLDSSVSPDLGFLAHGLEDADARLPALRTLEIRNAKTDGTTAALYPLLRALRALPTLTALSIATPSGGSNCVGMRIFDFLAAPVGGHWLLPRLRALALNGCLDVTGHEPLRVIRARRDAQFSDDLGKPPAVPPPERLSFLRLVSCGAVEDDTKDALNDAVDDLRLE